MRSVAGFLASLAIAFPVVPLMAQSGGLNLPKNIEAGSTFSIPTAGSGNAVLYIAGPAEVLKRDVQLGQPVAIAAGDLDNAGHYVVVLSSPSSAETGELDVVPANKPAAISFIAKPSRLPVGLQNGITAAVYVFDSYRNLIITPTPVSFQLSVASAATETRTVTTRQGAAWTAINSATKEGSAKFLAQAGDVSATRIIQQVPGDPCGLKMSARKVGDKIQLETDPLRDCSGNAVTDGTIVTFTESWNGEQTTVDVPLKHGVAEAEVPAYNGARLSVATGVVMGNEIRWEGRE
jgi:hypothetical protein